MHLEVLDLMEMNSAMLELEGCGLVEFVWFAHQVVETREP